MLLRVRRRRRRRLRSPASVRAALRVRWRPPSPPPRPAPGRVSVLLRMCRGRAAGWCLARLLCLPSGSPLAFSGRAACGCQSRGRAIRLRARSGPAPSVFLIKEAAAETRGAEPKTAAPSSGGAAVARNPATARSKLRCHTTLPPLSQSAPPSRPAHLRAGLRVCHTRSKERPPFRARCSCRRETPRSPGNSCSPPNSETRKPYTQNPTQCHLPWRYRSWVADCVWCREPVKGSALCSQRQQCVAATHTVNLSFP